MRYTLSLLLVLFALSTHAQTDTLIGRTAPSSVTNDVQALAEFLTQNADSEKEKANAIYNWVTHNIAFDIKADKDPDRETPTAEEVLRSKSTTGDGYTILFEELCLAAGLDAVTIRGYGKTWLYDDGVEYYIPRSGWNAVLIDGRWELMNPVRGAGSVSYAPGWLRKQLNKLTKDKVLYVKNGTFEFDYDPSYFMVDPIAYRYNYIPADPLWQLTEEAMPLKTFEQGDSAITAYNNYSNYRIKNRPEFHGAVGKRGVTLIENADRVNKYNENFVSILGAREAAQAAQVASTYIKEDNIKVAETSAELAKKQLDKAEQYFKEQQRMLSPHYNKLRRINNDKNREANSRIREVKLQDRLLLSKYRSKESLAERKLNTIPEKQSKAEDMRQDVQPNAINEVQTISIEKKPGDPMLDAIGDSVDAKLGRIDSLNSYIENEVASVNKLKENNKRRFETLMEMMQAKDSIYILEADARAHLLDSRDGYVKALMAKYDKADKLTETFHIAYLNEIDTIVNRTEDLMRTYLFLMRLNKTTLRDLEQYQRWYSKEPNVKPTYNKIAGNYIHGLDTYIQLYDYYSDYLKATNEELEAINTLYEEKERFTEYMEEGERTRKEITDREIEENKLFEEKDLENSIEQLTTLEAEIDKAMASVRKAHEERLEEERKMREAEEKAKEKE